MKIGKLVIVYEPDEENIYKDFILVLGFEINRNI